jgi:nucleoside-diphosphate-sugar epimerase
MARERVLVTGGSGFIGACLARALIADGHEVHLVLRSPSDCWRLASLHRRFTAHAADLRDSAALRRAVAACRPEVVYHLAAFGAYPSQTDRHAILATNLLGTANLLDALEGHDYRAVVHTGSSSEYGHKPGPIREDDCPEPRSDYGVAKAAATLLCQAEAMRGGPVITVRVFSAYGPWDDPGRLPSHVMGCSMRGEVPRVTAGCQPRDFIYVDDVIALLRVAAGRPDLAGRILHAGTGVQSTVRQMVETIAAVCGGPAPEFGTLAPRPGEPACWVASIEQTTRLTGWRPLHDLSSGVAAMKRWWLEHQVRSGRPYRLRFPEATW